jgi:hypothetical protein
MKMNAKKIGIAVAGCVAFGASTAAAGTWYQNLSGDFPVECQSASLTFSIGIAGPGGDVSASTTFPGACDPNADEVFEALSALGLDTYNKCINAFGWIDGADEGCANAAADLVEAAYITNKQLVELIPTSLNGMTVSKYWDFWARVWNVYPYNGTATLESRALASFGEDCSGNETEAWEGQLCDTDAAELADVPARFLVQRHGRFWAAGIDALGGEAWSNAACIGLASASVNGWVNPQSRSVSSHYSANGSVTCAGGQDADWLLITAGITFSGSAGSPVD